MKNLSTLFIALIFTTTGICQKPKKERKGPPPTHADVAYDVHDKTKLDFWQAEGPGPHPIYVYIHGGGWIGGDKDTNADPTPYLKKGISYASVNYRLTGEAPLPAPVHDAARAIQFIRSKAGEWNLKKDRMVLTGGSAGACTSMWLLCHDDLADPDSEDRVKRESTRVQGAVVGGGQTSIDPKQIEPWLGENVLKHRMINMAVGEKTIEGALANYAKHEALYKEFSAYNHVSKDDPPLYMSYGSDMTLPSKSAGHGIHHPVYGVKMKEKCDSVGQTCYLRIPKHSEPEINSNEFVYSILLEDGETEELFNGKDLTGWGFRPTKPRKKPNPIFAVVTEVENFDGKTESSDKRYVAKDGILVVTLPPGGRRIQQIWTTKEFSKDFTLTLDFRASPKADSGIFIRGKQLQCRDYILAGPYKELKGYKPQDWNEIVIKVTGTTAHCTCNGEVLEAAFEVPASGPIGLEGDMGQMEYRNIRITKGAE